MWDWFLKFSVPRTRRIIGMLTETPKANCSKPLAVIGLETTGLNHEDHDLAYRAEQRRHELRPAD